MRQFYKITDSEHGTIQDEQILLVPVDAGYVDGYAFGDRLLEGCMFKITVTDKNKLKAEISLLSKSYFSDLNQKEWLAAAVDHASTNDIFSKDESGEGEEVILYDTERPWDDQEANFQAEPIFADGYVPLQPQMKVAAPAKAIKVMSGVDLIARLKNKVRP